MKNLAILIGVPIVLWGVLIFPGIGLWGNDALRHSGVALVLCLGPAVATFLVIGRFTRTPDERLLATLASTGVRMGVCLGLGWVLHATLPEMFPAVFLYWLAVFYLVILFLEVWLLVKDPPSGVDSVSM